jgi:uncharacterized MnhB-related membrane protein
MPFSVWVILILTACFVITAFLVLTARKLMAIIIAIGVGSVLLEMLFFVFGAPIAGAVELSVGAGLISVLFIIATNVTDSEVDEVER